MIIYFNEMIIIFGVLWIVIIIYNLFCIINVLIIIVNLDNKVMINYNLFEWYDSLF